MEESLDRFKGMKTERLNNFIVNLDYMSDMKSEAATKLVRFK